MKFTEDQLHTAVSLYLAGRIMEENEKALWETDTFKKSKDSIPNLGRLLMIKNIGIGAIIIYSYAIENLFKAFYPKRKKGHLNINDIPHDLGLKKLEAIMFFKTIFPLLQKGFLRYNEPRQEENLIAPKITRKIFIKTFKYFTEKFSIELNDVKCFKVEFFNFKYPFIEELVK